METIKPIHYNLQFEPNLKTFTFQGLETLTFEVATPTDSIILDSVDLIIETCALKNSHYKVTGFKKEKKSLTIELDKKLPKGTYKLTIKFTGELKNSLSGFYRSRIESSGKEDFIATTQFEPADARHAFPSIDHPSYKARFDITMIVDANLTAISNTTVKKEEIISGGRKKVVFETTPYMSTYLLYLGAGKFDIYEERYKNILIRGITTPGKAHYTKFAVDCAQKSLEYFEDYFGEPYPLKKLDLIAVPDFAAGAMENWGAITFRENLILFYEESSSISTKQRIAEVTAHEVAHQWFGNLVTMKWWDDLWLNESFATFMAYKVLDHYWPEWNIWSEYILSTVFRGMKLDSLNSSHPIHVEVHDVAETNELFDEIAYDKGGSILRMIEGYLGDKEFRNGLRLYIQKFKYGNTEAKDLWGSLEKASGKPITSIMESQVNKTGFPYVMTSVENKTLHLVQSRFLLKDEADETQLWSVPATLRIDDETRPILLENKTEDIQLGKNNPFLYLNGNYYSFFITNYSDDLHQLLGKQIHKLSDIEKVGLIHDLDLLVFSGKRKLTEFTEFLTMYFAEEKAPVVLLYTVEKLHTIYNVLKLPALTYGESFRTLRRGAEIRRSDSTALHPRTYVSEEFREGGLNTKKVGLLLKQNAKKAIELTGYNPVKSEHPYLTQLRSASLFALSLFDDADVKQFAEDHFSKYLQNETSLHPDLRTAAYSLAVWYDESQYDTVMKLYKHSTNQEEKVRFLTALGNTKNKTLLQKSFQFALSEDVRFNQMPSVIFSAAENPYAKDAALDWLFNHWNDLKIKAGGTVNHIFRRLLKEVIPNCGIGRVSDVKSFIQKSNTTELSKTFDQVFEELEVNEAFIKRNR